MPERTCVVCRKKASKQDLVRFVIGANGQLIDDHSFKLPGRGAYVHANCMNKQMEIKLMYSLNKRK